MYYIILAVELDGLGQTVTLAPPAVDAVSTVIRLHAFWHDVYTVLHNKQISKESI